THIEAFHADSACYNRFPVGCCLNDLDPGSTTYEDRRTNHPCPLIELIEIVDETRELHAQNTSIVTTDPVWAGPRNDQTCFRHGPIDPRPDLFDEELRSVSIWLISIRTEKEQGRVRGPS